MLTLIDEVGSDHLSYIVAQVRQEKDPMTIYMDTCSQVDQNGKGWLNPKEVSGFVLRALQNEERFILQEV